jgi:hypothetical protein
MKTELQINGNKPAASLHVLIAYDSVRSGKRAKELCDQLGQELAPEFELNLSLWSLSVLQIRPLARAVATGAARAALLIVAVNGDEALPPPVKSWIGKCARGARATGGALVAQLHGIVRMNQELSPAYCCLRQIARDAGMDFFSEVIELAGAELDCWIETIHERAHMRTSVLDVILQQH